MNDNDFDLAEAPAFSATRTWCVWSASPRHKRDRMVSVHDSRAEALAEERRLNALAIAEEGNPLRVRGVTLYYCCPAESGYQVRWRQQQKALEAAREEFAAASMT